MRSRIAILAAALALSTVAAASAQVAVDPSSGTVVRIDPQSNVIMLDNGRFYRVTPNTVFLVDNRPVAFGTLRTGEHVVIQSGEPVVYREGRWMAVQQGAPVVVSPAPGQASPPTVTAPPPVVSQAPGTTVVVPAPGPVVAAAPSGVRQTIYGTVEDVDRDGKVKIKTERDSFETRVAPGAVRQIRKGDNVVIDLTIVPLGTSAR